MIESDGFITQEIDISPTEVEHIGNLERVNMHKAKPAEHCQFPRCEECREYVSYKGSNYCTVPMVMSKQIWRLTEDLLVSLEQRISELENLVTDEILRPSKPRKTDPANYTWSDYFGEDK